MRNTATLVATRTFRNPPWLHPRGRPPGTTSIGCTDFPNDIPQKPNFRRDCQDFSNSTVALYYPTLYPFPSYQTVTLKCIWFLTAYSSSHWGEEHAVSSRDGRWRHLRGETNLASSGRLIFHTYEKYSVACFLLSEFRNPVYTETLKRCLRKEWCTFVREEGTVASNYNPCSQECIFS